MSIEAMKQALEALESLQELCSEESGFVEQVTIWTPEAITALRAAIEQAEKPVECMCGICKLGKREWVGLTDEERRNIREWRKIQDELGPVWAPMMLYLYIAIEAKLKEKNETA